MRLVRLEDIKNLKPFDCGDEDLNDFLLSDARLYNEQFLANTFVLEDDNETVAYYSLLNDKISQTTLSKNLWRKLRKSIPHEKHLGSYPAVKIGRLAVSKSYRGMDIGTKLVGAIMRLFISQHGHSACRFLTVDAYKDAVTFYEKNGFKKMVNDSELPENALTVPLYLDLKQVES
jgi:predicted GNAT family N-acyltransferase